MRRFAGQAVRSFGGVGGFHSSTRSAAAKPWTTNTISATQTFEYTCNVEAEPLHRYQSGGYHPIHLGDVPEHRYKILHKLGFCGYSTVWAARDYRDHKYVALKSATAERHQSHEARMLHHLTASAQQHPGYAHLPRLLNHFTIHGPNGCHSCLVSDVVGTNVGDLISRCFKDDRLPAKLARSFTKQALLGLDCIHDHALAHGDVHIRNLALTVLDLEELSEEAFMSRLGHPRVGTVSPTDSQPIAPGIPRYLVEPTCFPEDIDCSMPRVKLIDFGKAFLRAQPPCKLHTPLVVRPPEAVFEDCLDLEVDVWSAGCMIFELITGQPPFDSFLITQLSLLQQILESTGDRLPERWKSAFETMLVESNQDKSDAADVSLQAWLKEVYFDECKAGEFGPGDLAVSGKLIQSMCRMEPRDRVSIKQALSNSLVGRTLRRSQLAEARSDYDSNQKDGGADT